MKQIHYGCARKERQQSLTFNRFADKSGIKVMVTFLIVPTSSVMVYLHAVMIAAWNLNPKTTRCNRMQINWGKITLHETLAVSFCFNSIYM